MKKNITIEKNNEKREEDKEKVLLKKLNYTKLKEALWQIEKEKVLKEMGIEIL